MISTKTFLEIARVIAKESKDPITKVGAVIVRNNKIIGTGYNGYPSGVEELWWERPEKYEYVIHSEINAVLNATGDLRGADIYCTHQPCHRCLGFIIQAGISRVFYKEDYISNEKAFEHLSKFVEVNKIQ